MRKVTEKMSNALYEGISRKSGNTKVTVEVDVFGDEYAHMYLHDNLIASHNTDNGQVILLDCGWQTVTTKERLNGVLATFNSEWRIHQIKGQWYISDGMGVRHEWNGSWTIL